MTATNQDIQAVEQRLPSIGNSCTVPLTTTTSDIILRKSIPTTSVLSTRDGDRQLATTLPIGSDDISSSPRVRMMQQIANFFPFLYWSLS